MAVVKVFGASDDLIEVSGDLSEEFGCYGADEGRFLAFSDGTVLHIVYGNEGIWRITPRARGTATYTKVEATDPEGDYTDRVTLDGDLRWCVFGDGFVKGD